MNGIDAYLDRLASADPTPGGGSAATIVGALGAALIAMVARITAQSERYAAVRDEAETLVEAADVLRERFEAARQIDESAYGRVVAAMALPKGTEGEKQIRTAELQAALREAAEAPLVVAGMSAEGFLLAERAAGLGNVHLVSDVESAVHFFRAALAASIANVRINHRFLKDPAFVSAQEERLVAIFSAAEESAKRALARIGGSSAR